MSLIDATAEENRRIRQHHLVQAGPPVGDDRRRIHLLIPCIAGLMVVAGLGRSMLVSEVSQTPPPAVTADADSAPEARPPVPGNAGAAEGQAPSPLPVTERNGLAPMDSEAGQTQPRVVPAGLDNTIEGRSPVPANVGAAEGQAPSPLPVTEPDGRAPIDSEASRTQPPAATTAADSKDRSPPPGNADAPAELVQGPRPAAKPDDPIGGEENRTVERGTGSAIAAAAETDRRPMATPVAGHRPGESPGSGTETRNDGAPADTQASTAADRTAAVDSATSHAGEPPANVRSLPPPADKAGATAEPERTTPVRRVARVVSDVNMRAGPGNGKAVLTSLHKGTPVEVINCRQWCEVIYSGQRGWIYKRFVGKGSHQLN